MKHIKVKFVDFWNDYIPEKGSIYKLLSKKYIVDLSDTPDYLFYGCFGYKHLDYDCIKIFIASECIVPDFNICDYAIGYYHLDFSDRYLYHPWCYEEEYKENINLMINKKVDNEKESLNREFCAIVYANGLNTDGYRLKLIDELSKYKKIASGGLYGNNIGYAVKDKIEFQSKYKFVIAAENVSSNGYISEKLIDAYASNAVPIYWGDKEVSKIFNPDSFIDCTKYKIIEEVINKIKEVDNNDDLYLKMLNTYPLINKEEWLYETKENELLNFLINIFDQDINEAKRINHFAANKDYINLKKDWHDAYRFSILRIINRIKTIKRRKTWH